VGDLLSLHQELLFEGNRVVCVIYMVKLGYWVW